MKKHISLKVLTIWAVALLLGGAVVATGVYADEEANLTETNSEETSSEESSEENTIAGTNISLMPVSKILQLSPNTMYEDKMTVSNDGNEPIEIEVYTAPYSYTFSEDEGIYKLGFSAENNYTQIVRWITFDNGNGEWVKTRKYEIPAHGSVEVQYRITTPGEMPAGGQYAVIFAHTLTSVVSENGIRTEASPGMVIFGRSLEGESKLAPSISDMKVGLGVEEDGVKRDNFSGSAKVKNDGNVDFSVVAKLKVDPIFGVGSYETPEDGGRMSVIPETELSISDEWKETPGFGLFKATWTVMAGDVTETVETIVFINPVPVIIIGIIVLTIIIVCVIIVVRKRKERRSRLAV